MQFHHRASMSHSDRSSREALPLYFVISLKRRPRFPLLFPGNSLPADSIWQRRRSYDHSFIFSSLFIIPFWIPTVMMVNSEVAGLISSNPHCATTNVYISAFSACPRQDWKHLPQTCFRQICSLNMALSWFISRSLLPLQTPFAGVKVDLFPPFSFTWLQINFGFRHG